MLLFGVETEPQTGIHVTSFVSTTQLGKTKPPLVSGCEAQKSELKCQMIVVGFVVWVAFAVFKGNTAGYAAVHGEMLPVQRRKPDCRHDGDEVVSVLAHLLVRVDVFERTEKAAIAHIAAHLQPFQHAEAVA